MSNYKIHHGQRYKLIFHRFLDLPDKIIISTIQASWFGKHKDEFLSYKNTLAIYQGIKSNDYLIIYNTEI
jgi:hypothetical protein